MEGEGLGRSRALRKIIGHAAAIGQRLQPGCLAISPSPSAPTRRVLAMASGRPGEVFPEGGASPSGFCFWSGLTTPANSHYNPWDYPGDYAMKLDDLSALLSTLMDKPMSYFNELSGQFESKVLTSLNLTVS